MVADLVASFYDETVPLHARGRLLDFGCGKAPLYGHYARYVDKAVRVDWGNSLHGNPYIDVEHDLTQPMPFEDGAFDTIICSDVLEHLPVPENAWSEMARVLAPGGVLILNVPFYYWLHEEPYDYYRYTRHALTRFAEQAGLEVLSLRPLGGAPEVLLDILGKLLSRGRWGRKVAAAVPASYKAAMRVGRFRRLSARTGNSFPIGYGMVARKPDRSAPLPPSQAAD